MRKRKPTFILVIVACVFLVLGIGILSVGVVQGGNVHFKQQRFGPVSTVVFTDKKASKNNDTYTSDNKVTSIELDADLGDITFEKGDEFSVEFKNFDDGEVSFKDDNGDITIDTGVKSISISLAGFDNADRRIIVTVPESCKEIEIDANLGSVKLSNLTLDKLDVKVDLGSIDATGINIRKGDFNLNLGDLDFEGNVSEELKADADLGSIDILLNKTRSDYSYDLKTDLGNVSIEGSSHHEYKDSNGSKPLIKGKASLGDIDIDFK
ncbi:DUF4097 family beta strand repeat-containing protein [Breznakia pachnodae]|uniref:DUF4097 domain-containing protein n=1 Tax=Breznakia pachnodae TaxID=265178 RepID=A0ABU0DZ99_9FIRM|nr:DUF4097 family beta strand repeat-containing protein [Breznakia pachnodae]MDQ0359965.1 hypothetical protein [Breznakia pachnodae]